MRISPPTARRGFSVNDNLVPLINIIFLLLIFFMIAGRIAVSDVVPLEALRSAAQTPQTEADVVLLVSVVGDVYVGSEQIDHDALVTLLQERLVQANDPNRFRIQIKVDALLPVEELKTVLSRVRSAGVLKVSLLTQESLEP
ncbi:biopolymer transporter ExbD [Marinobacter sp. S6332]|uniref:ExbD/TolR family protein n=1 Tax=Marinobacter sp. S6332 TaxID=2926403 RepID=UPI001FF601C8|nr:biopolymer transporter ExbD [Marinobacter sp. S6332]MCK0163112.1 biopolymer transporter ExbD [Marinobacter sp. S6332]